MTAGVIKITVFGVSLQIICWRPTISLKWPGFQVSCYFCPVLSEHPVHWWGQKSAYFRSGFILRVLWFGFCLRYGRDVPLKNKIAVGCEVYEYDYGDED